MAKDCKDILLVREGTSQAQRFLDALDPTSLKLQDFGHEDWVLFAYSFAKHVNFFETENFKIPMGNWQDLFNIFELPSSLPYRGTPDYEKLLTKVKETLDAFSGRQNLAPHLTLFISFLELLSLTQSRFNGLTQRHLDFYYTQILQIEKELPEPDKAHIIFELAKRIEDFKVPNGTELAAGKDGDGKNLIFETAAELIANKTKAAAFRSIYNDTNRKEIRAAQTANSRDGKGEPFQEDNAFWHPFGYTSEQDTYPQLDHAELGLAVASPMLALAEGERNIAVTFTLNRKAPKKAFTVEELIQHLEIYYTGEKKWEGPIPLQKKLTFLGVKNASVDLDTSLSKDELRLVVQLDRDMNAVTGYNPEVHLDAYTTTEPLLKVVFNTETPTGYDLFRSLVHVEVTKVDIEVSVSGIQGVHIENDTGALKPNKPFYPFTTQPTKRSNFYVDYPELFSKQWGKATVDLLWKGAPNSFKTHYFAYREDDATSSAIYADSIFIEENNKAKVALAENQPEVNKVESFENNLVQNALIINPDPDNLIVKDEDHFKATSYVMHKEQWDVQNPLVDLFVDEDGDNLYNTLLNVNNNDYTLGKSGPIKLSLNQSFLQEMFPKIYALALASTNPDTLIPNSPYVPFVETISLSYSAKESTNINVSAQKAYESKRITLFHHTPFGQYEEHEYLKRASVENDILPNKKESVTPWLLPDYCHGGELYIGLEDALSEQNVSLLFQILEGSENPQADSFEGDQRVNWSVLCNNHWMNLDDELINNEIDNFLTSGIVSFGLPKQATNANTLLPEGYFWIRAKLHKQFDAVCKLIDIKAQAVLATFADNDNELSHLENGLEAGTISKLVNRVPQIKGVSQPYSSFGGRPLEEDTAFYRRVSERLRHKNRAITIWDYEHLVLQEFPEIFKALCLKHTKDDNFLSPGDVTVVVIPDIINKNVFNIYQPRVSKATLNKIQSYINSLNSMHVDAQVINPDYEEITVSLNVKFHKGFDEKYYKKELNLDIKRFLSPWAFDTSKNIVFGVELHSSVLIDYLEDLPYVDFLEEVQLTKTGDEPKKVVSPSKPGAILVSAETHNVNPINNPCKDNSVAAAETCQY